MQTMSTSTEGPRRGNIHDDDYDQFRDRMNRRFLENIDGGKRPLFTTSADGLWDAYLASFPEASRQYHNCSACRHFIQRFGGLVTIREDGSTASAIWDEADADSEHTEAVRAMLAVIRRAKVTGVFLSGDRVWGTPTTGEWTHFAVVPPTSIAFKRPTMSAGQAMAEKREDHKNVLRAMEEFTAPMLAQALSLLNSDSLYRSEKVKGPAQWLADLHAASDAAPGRRGNIVWRAIATAPAGFCHPRSSMVGTLLEDIASGLPFDDVSAKFRAKMHPLQYQRPQVAPSAGNIAAAEKLVEKLGIARSLERRFARLDEVEDIWKPETAKPSNAGGVFGHLKPKDNRAVTPVTAAAQPVTFEKFRRVVLPMAKRIEINVPAVGNFAALATAVHADAPPILQWDTGERRNPVSWYLYHGGSPVSRWGIGSGWSDVSAVTLQPNLWHAPEQFAHQGEGVLFVLPGCRDSANVSRGLFPEILRSELREVRAVIEAHSRSGKLEGYEEASACGLILQKSSTAPLHVRVTESSGARIEYRIDRWD